MGTETASSAIDFLMEGDPAIRWQTMRDLLDCQKAEYERERAKIESKGWGKRLLDLQDEDGKWGGGIYSPKWISTTYTLLLLREMGLPPNCASARRGAQVILDSSVKSDKDSLRSLDTCIAGMWLALGAYFGSDDPKLETLVEHLLEEQMPDGGWNCRRHRVRSTHHSSFHTTFNVLDGVRDAIDRGIGPTPLLQKAEERALELLLQHQMFRSDKTGNVINSKFKQFAFPPRWHYDVLRGLHYIRTTRFIKDPRLDEAFELVEAARGKGDRWRNASPYSGKVFFNLEPGREISRWNTLRALRCLRARSE